MQNHTHTNYNHHWYIKTRLQCSHIFLTRYAKSHIHRLQSWSIHQNKVTMPPYLHDEICKMTHTHRSCSQVVDLAARGHWISSIFVDGSEKWFLACNGTTKLPSLTCTFGLQEHFASGRRKQRKNIDHWTQDDGLFILKTMIIGHGMKLFILMPGCSGLPPRTRLRERSMSQEFFWQLC
jgi:hypothetical protein